MATFWSSQLLVLALLVGNAAAGLASGLAGSLALAATAVLSALAKITSLDSLDMLHDSNLRWICYNRYLIITLLWNKVNTQPKINYGHLPKCFARRNGGDVSVICYTEIFRRAHSLYVQYVYISITFPSSVMTMPSFAKIADCFSWSRVLYSESPRWLAIRVAFSVSIPF